MSDGDQPYPFPPEAAEALARSLDRDADVARRYADGTYDDAEIDRLAALSPLAYEREREDAAERLGIARVTMLDKVVRAARGGADTKGQGRPLDLPAPEPWPGPVDGVALCGELAEFFSTYARLPERGAIALVLWSIHTHCFVIWRYTPRLHVTGPTKRSGKSRVLRLLLLVTCKPLPSAQVSAPALYRSIEATHPTFLIDEADLSVKDNPNLLRVLDGGYERGQQAVLTVGEEHEPRMFDLFAPVALAGIGRLAGQLEDRSIRLTMRRALPTDRPPKITSATEAQGERLQRQIARWVADHQAALTAAQPDMSKLPDRVDDHWTPLWAIANVVGDNWPLLAEQATAALTPQDDETDSLGERLIHDTKTILDRWSREWISCRELVTELVALEGRPWAEMPRTGRALTTNRLARLLAGFHIYSQKFGPEDNRESGYRLESFFDAFARHARG